jgi:hypothetical protein
MTGRSTGLPPGWGIGVAESDDLNSWNFITELPQFGSADALGRAAPGVVVIDGAVHLFAQTYGNGAADALFHAVSHDGVDFLSAAGGNPVFSPAGRWSCGRAIDADVVVFRDRLILGYATRDTSMSTQMVGFASAPIGSDFSRDSWTDLSIDGPAIAPELEWEGQCIEAPALCVRDGRLVVFYAGGYNNDPQQIGVAASDDGVVWTRLSDQPLVRNGHAGSWNSSESGHPGLLKTPDGASHLFFQGNDDNGHTWRIAAAQLSWDGIEPKIVGRE